MNNKEQAVKAVKNYIQTGNKKDALLKAGYSKETARSRQTEVIERGTQQLLKRNDPQSQKILHALGKSRQDIIESFNELAFKQNRDLKLKAQMLSQLYKTEIGIDINGGDITNQAQLNITLNAQAPTHDTKHYTIE
jgi:phage terminase small subunit